MDPLRVVVVIGTGAAGTAAAQTLRAEGFDGRLVVLGAEPEIPYRRPPLSKAYLMGRTRRERLRLHDESFYAEHEIDLRIGTPVAEIDRPGAEVVLDNGDRIGYDRLLLATGAAPRHLRVPGGELDGVHYLRTLADADALRSALTESEGRAVVVGGGWIGAEVASSARQQGWEVAIVDPLPVPPARTLGAEMGAFFWELQRAHGVSLLSGASVARLEGHDHVERVVTTDGRHVDADLVVVGIGVLPRTELAERAGLAVTDGVVVDPFLTTSDAHILAVGDVANAFSPRYGRHVRVEHWETARGQGRAAARTILGRGSGYDAVPFFYSDQYDVSMEFRGRRVGEEQVVVRGAPDDGAFVAFWLAGDRVRAAMNVNVWELGEALDELVATAAPVEAKLLADARIPLEDAVRRAAPAGS